MRRKTVKFVKHIPVYILLSFVVVLILMPLFWMFNSSFKAKVEILAYPPTFFAQVGAEGFNEGGFARAGNARDADADGIARMGQELGDERP